MATAAAILSGRLPGNRRRPLGRVPGNRRRHLVRPSPGNGAPPSRAAGSPQRAAPSEAFAMSGLESLALTGEEVARLRRAFADEEFRRLFAEYAAELSDPARRAVFEAEVAALERERGVEARFLHPTPGWALRTSQAGRRRCYLNVCSHRLVGRPEARAEAGGTRWTLPHCLSPGREELGRAGRRLVVYDVLFHPDALRLAARSPRFRRLLDDTALDAVDGHFQAGLDRANAAPLRRVKYKGVPQASLLRTPLPGAAPQTQPGGDSCRDAPLPPFRTPYAYPPPPAEAHPTPAPEPAPDAATPQWTLRQRSYVDLQDYRCCRDSAPSPVPRELEVTVELPLLSAAAQAQLEVRGRELRLDSRRPAAYRLRLRLPYAVDQDAGTATFDRARRRLVVTLPVLPRPQHAFPAGSGQEEPPGSGRSSPPSPEPPGAPCGADSCPASGELPAPATHVEENHVQLPVCSEESGPAAHGTPQEVPPLGLPPQLPGDLEASDWVASYASSCSPLEASDGDSSPAPGPTCARENVCQEPGCLPPAHEGCLGPSVEPPECPGRTGPAGSPVGLGAKMDPEHRPEVANAVPSSELDHASVPFCGSGSDHAGSTEDHNSTDPDRNGETSASSPVAPTCSPSAADLSATAVRATDSPPGAPVVSRTGLGGDPEPALSPSSSPDFPLPASSPTPPLCPPFQCTQDEEALILLLQVPGIDPQSLKGEVGTHHYRVCFASKDSVSYTLLLQLPAENKLTSPESSISFSLDNAVILLTKAPDTTGLWTKLYFGPNEDCMQEKLFITKDNVAEVLLRLQRPSCPRQSEANQQPSIEVLEVSEGQSRIRLKAQEQNSPETGQAEEEVNPGTEGSEPPFRAGNHCLITDTAGEHTTKTEKASYSLAAAETKELAGWGQSHCVEPDPPESGSATSGKSQITKLQESESASAATVSEQTQSERDERVGTGQASCPGFSESGRPPAPVLRETDPRDGSVQLISHHATHCAVTFQNPLLYELD